MGHHTWPHQVAQIFNEAKPKFTVLNHILMFGVKSKDALAKVKKDTKETIILEQDLMESMVSKNGSKVVKEGIPTTH